MQRAVAVLVALGMMAGCLADEAGTDSAGADPHDPAAPLLAGGGNGSIEAVLETYPLLIEISPQLRESAAEVTVPAGLFRLVRLVYDKDVWGEEEPWDGSASVALGMAFRTEGEGVMMRAFGFKPPEFVEDRTIRPFVSFSPISGDGWMSTWTSSSCSGCSEVPKHETAWLLGADEPLTFRIGVLGDGQNAESLWSRPVAPVRADAQTEEAFAGVAYRYVVLASEYSGQSGIMEAEWSQAPAPGVSVGRTSRYLAEAEIKEPGIFVASLVASENAGIEEWSYALEAPGLSGSWEGPWVHEPTGYSYLAQIAGIAYAPLLAVQGNAGAGDVSFRAERAFTAVSEPTGLARFSYEFANIGHAGVDLDALFGWDTSREPYPSSGSYTCLESSFAPRLCVGDAPLEATPGPAQG